MATIKSFTDISQSKKLAEILPLESADMYYEPLAGFCTEPSEAKIGDIEYAHPRSIRCWSLAALLSVLPQSVRLVGTPKDSYWYCECVNGNNQWYAGFGSAENPVDACVAMIERLHELKVL